MKIICIADLQGQCESILPEMLPKGDMLLIAGDLASWGTKKELETVNKWLGTLSYKYKIVVAGNHDQALEKEDGHKLFTNAIYLQDELVEIEGLRIYGSPVNEMNELRLNYSWGFCDPKYIIEATEKISENLDILLTHGGPMGILDKINRNGKQVGSPELLRAVLKKKPLFHIFGHIHESYGILGKDKTEFINAAIMNERNELFQENGELMHQPIVINIKTNTKR